MKIKKTTAIVSGIVLILAIGVLAGILATKNSSAIVEVPGRPKACKEGDSCTAGQTCCWNTAGTYQKATCGNGGTWGPTITCGKSSDGWKCDGNEGVGSKCVKEKNNDDNSGTIGIR